MLGNQPLVYEEAVEVALGAVGKPKSEQVGTLADVRRDPCLDNLDTLRLHGCQVLRPEAVGSAVGQNGDLVGEVLCAAGGAESVVSQGEDGEVLVNVQMSVAANTDVPAAPIAGKAEDSLVPLVEPLRLLVHLDVGPHVVKSRGHDDGPGAGNGVRLLGRSPRSGSTDVSSANSVGSTSSAWSSST